MSLFTDGTISTSEDLRVYESSILEVANTEGIELEAKYRRSGWDLGISYSYVEGKTTSPYDETGFPMSKDTSFNNLYRVPNHAFKANLGYQVNTKIFVSTAFRYIGDRLEPVYGSKPLTLKSYYVLDLYGEYRLDAKWKLFADLKNITDQKYFEIAGYNSKRFNFMLGANFSL